MPGAARLGRTIGVLRSLLIYYGPVWRGRRLERFYAEFLRPGDLAFDIGAHVGNRVRAFRRLGARVVAVEPQPDFVAVLRWCYGRDRGVVIEGCGVAARRGVGDLHLSRRTPTVSSLSGRWTDDVRVDPQFARVRWDETVRVRLCTLDELIERHGEPDFVKIDVEGSEADVLDGLSRPLTALSFEYLPVVVDRAVDCVRRLEELARYRYRHSRVESHRWAEPHWLDADGIVEVLRGPELGDRSGDVYARRLE